MGTISKALASGGGYIAGRRILIFNTSIRPGPGLCDGLVARQCRRRPGRHRLPER